MPLLPSVGQSDQAQTEAFRALALHTASLEQIAEYLQQHPTSHLAQEIAAKISCTGDLTSNQSVKIPKRKLKVKQEAHAARRSKNQEKHQEKHRKRNRPKTQRQIDREKRIAIRAQGLDPFERGIRAIDCSDWIIENNRSYGSLPSTTGSLQRFTAPYNNNNNNNNNMAPSTLSRLHSQRRAITQMSKILGLRNSTSPFTLIIDDLNQPSYPLVSEFTRRGISRNVNVILVTFHTKERLGNPAIVHIQAWDHDNQTADQILTNLEAALSLYQESLVVVDSLADLLGMRGVDMNTLFNLVAAKYRSNLVGVYHQDMLMNYYPYNPYAPQLLDTLKYVATCILTCKSFAHVLAAKAAKERSLPEPTHGLLQGAEGVVQSMGANDCRGMVMDAEFRRKSGRPETETFYLPAPKVSDYHPPVKEMMIGVLKSEVVVCLDMVELYNSQDTMERIRVAADEMSSTFNLELTEKQKEAREGVVLPYFDAQKGEGGEGGRILYEMGEEDDFDEEEDEI